MDNDELTSYQEAIKNSDSKKRLEAMKFEVKSMSDVTPLVRKHYKRISA
jgi:hypothetical protein